MHVFHPILVPTSRWLGLVPISLILIIFSYQAYIRDWTYFLIFLSFVIFALLLGILLGFLGQKALIHHERLVITGENISFKSYIPFKRTTFSLKDATSFHIEEMKNNNNQGVNPADRLRTIIIYILFGSMGTQHLFKQERVVLLNAEDKPIYDVHITYFDNEQKKQIINLLSGKLLRK